MKEIQLIEEIKKRAGKSGKGIKLGIGDDCAVLICDKNNYLLWATDMLTEGTHFQLKKTPYKKIGRKAVAVNISDIAAMGGVPKYITVSIGVPPKMNRSSVRAIYDGIFNVCRKYGIKVIGGDTNSSRSLVIDVSILGLVQKKHLLMRSGAKEKDLILITGPVRNGKKEHLDFVPRIKEAQFLTRNYKINSMIDVSDGIAPDLSRICNESKVGCRLDVGSVPLSKGLRLKDALHYGESFELLFTASSKEARKLLENTKNTYFIIGRVVRKKDGKRFVDTDGRVKNLKMEGFKHL